MSRFLFFLVFLFLFMPRALAGFAKPLYTGVDAKTEGSLITYPYRRESQYLVRTRCGYLTDVALFPGEEITFIAGGDTSLFLVDQAVVAGRSHVYVKPKARGSETNIIINTPLRSYRLRLVSTDAFDAIVDWQEGDGAAGERPLKSAALSPPEHARPQPFFSEEKVKKSEASRRKKEKLLYYGYAIVRRERIGKDRLPLSIYDDGKKTYLRLPALPGEDLPVLLAVENKGKSGLRPVSFRAREGLIVADRLFTRGRLLYNDRESFDFIRRKGERP